MSVKDKEIITAAIPLLIIVIIFSFTFKIIFGMITTTNKNISDLKKTESILSDKILSIKEVSVNTASYSDLVLNALPGSSPSFLVYAQIKSLAVSNQLAISNLKSFLGDVDSKDISSLVTTFELTGSKNQIIYFLQQIGSIAPLTYIEKFDLSGEVGVATSNITLKTYFAPLPTTIPAVTQPVTDLNSTEKEIMKELTTLIIPQVVTDVGGSKEGSNPFPFGQ